MLGDVFEQVGETLRDLPKEVGTEVVGQISGFVRQQSHIQPVPYRYYCLYDNVDTRRKKSFRHVFDIFTFYADEHI